MWIALSACLLVLPFLVRVAPAQDSPEKERLKKRFVALKQKKAELEKQLAKINKQIAEIEVVIDPVKKDLAALQGNWKAVELISEGKKAQPQEFQDIKYQFKGDQMLPLKERPSKEQITIRVDPTCQPKTIDLVVTRNGKTFGTVEGIYELKNDTLRICLQQKNKGVRERPLTFDENKNGIAIVTLKRIRK